MCAISFLMESTFATYNPAQMWICRYIILPFYVCFNL